MKKTYVQQLTEKAKRASAWGKIIAPSLAPKPYTGVIRHIATAY